VKDRTSEVAKGKGRTRQRNLGGSVGPRKGTSGPKRWTSDQAGRKRTPYVAFNSGEEPEVPRWGFVTKIVL